MQETYNSKLCGHLCCELEISSATFQTYVAATLFVHCSYAGSPECGQLPLLSWLHKLFSFIKHPYSTLTPDMYPFQSF